MVESGPDDEDEELLGMTAIADPVLAELWDNEADSACDCLLTGECSAGAGAVAAQR